MSFLARELSVLLGEPIELFRFTSGSTVWTMTSNSFSQVYLGETYQPVSMERGAIELSRDFGKAVLEIRMPRSNTLVSQFISTPPDFQVDVKVLRYHAGDTEYRPIWMGRVISVEFQGGLAVVRCETNYTSMRRAGLRATFSPGCRHSLYKVGCYANDTAFRVSGNLTGISGVVISAAGFATKPDGWFSGGRVKVTYNSVTYQRMIIGHSGTNLTLLSPLVGAPSNAPYEAFAGCDHTLATCYSKFGNSINYGGWPWKPTKNPFTGDPIG